MLDAEREGVTAVRGRAPLPAHLAASGRLALVDDVDDVPGPSVLNVLLEPMLLVPGFAFSH